MFTFLVKHISFQVNFCTYTFCSTSKSNEGTEMKYLFDINFNSRRISKKDLGEWLKWGGEGAERGAEVEFTFFWNSDAFCNMYKKLSISLCCLAFCVFTYKRNLVEGEILRYSKKIYIIYIKVGMKV